MKRLLPLLLAWAGLTLASAAEPPVLVSVHGAWAGGWHFRKLAPLLEAKGWKVYRPSLSGLGEHFNTATPDIGLATHIDDIVNLILFEDLHDVILLGHSYGGMVITGVADRIPDRIRRLVYVDAYLPVEGDSAIALGKDHGAALLAKARDGFIAPWWVTPGKPMPRDVPHPVKTLTEPIHLANPVARNIPGLYILTVEKDQPASGDDFFAASERARARGWPVQVMTGDHNPQWRQPEALAELLSGLH